MRARRARVYLVASGRLAARMAWLVVVTAVEFVTFPLLWPFYLIRRAHRRAHEKEE